MVRTIEIDGEKMVAVVLGDTFRVSEETLEDYRKALFDVLEAALLNPEAFKGCWFEGNELYSYLQIVRALQGGIQGECDNRKKGGKA